jgi:glycosyltransferase involved in cell wall biosynthesis
LLYLGRLELEKGVEFIADVVASMQGGRVELEVAGWGSLATELKSRYADHSSIKLLGPVKGERKCKTLERCDVLVVPSNCPEVFGVVIVEAFAHGKPVIASRIGGIPEIVHDGRTGFLLPPEDHRAWKKLVSSLEADRSVLTAMAGSCFDEAVLYSPDRIGHEYRSIYQALLGDKARTAE